jgi:hypothetical protein
VRRVVSTPLVVPETAGSSHTNRKPTHAPTIVAGFLTTSADATASDQELRITSALKRDKRIGRDVSRCSSLRTQESLGPLLCNAPGALTLGTSCASYPAGSAMHVRCADFSSPCRRIASPPPRTLWVKSLWFQREPTVHNAICAVCCPSTGSSILATSIFFAVRRAGICGTLTKVRTDQRVAHC